MNGCSLISIKQGPSEPKHRPEMLTVNEYYCEDLTKKECLKDFEVTISRSHITEYYQMDKACRVILDNSQFIVSMLQMSCSEFSEFLNQ